MMKYQGRYLLRSREQVWLWEVEGHLFSNEEFHIQQGGKIEDFEN